VRRRGLPSWTLALPLAAAAALGWGWWRSGQPVERPAWRFSVDLGPDAVAGLSMTAALSPDGNRIVFLIRGPRGAQLATRLLADSRETVLSGTDNGFLPFFSPDGQWIAFFSTGKLKKISVLGGAATSLCDAPGARGGWWGDDDRIVASLDGQALSVIPAAGGQPQLLTTKGDQEVGGLRWPQVLPGGETVLATAGTTKGGSFEAASIVAVSLKTGQLKTLHKGGYFGRYLAPDHLLFVSQATIFALPFDPKRLEVRGAPVTVADELAANSNTGGGQFHVSPSGTLVFLKGKGASLSRPTAWLDAAGRLEPVPGAVGSHPRFSPDGKRLALLTDNDITVYDFERSIASRLPFPAAQYPVWTPDGRYLIFLARNRLYLGRVDGSAQPVEFERPAGVLSFGLGSAAVPTSVSPDGRTLVAHASGGATLEDLYLFPIDLSDPEHPQVAKPSAFVSSPGDDIEAVFSPDGKWIAYSGNESGVLQVFVRSVAGGDRAGRTQISTSPGRYPAWSRDGRTLFYVAIQGHIMAVPYTVRDGAFAPAVPHVWSPTPVQIVARNINYDVHPDGKRLIVNTPPDVGEGKSSSVHLTFVLNILDEVRRRVPLDARR